MSKRTEELKIRISPEDKERIKLKMEDAGVLNMSAYVRKMALDGICIRLDLQDVRQLVSMLQRCTNNLNQYAKRANETGRYHGGYFLQFLRGGCHFRQPHQQKTVSGIYHPFYQNKGGLQGRLWKNAETGYFCAEKIEG